MSEVRRDIINDTWVIVETDSKKIPLHHIEEREPKIPCPFCRGQEALTPPQIFVLPEETRDNWQVRVIPNKNPILRIEGELFRSGVGIHDKVTGIGANEIIIETPKHITNFHQLTNEQVLLVLKTYQQRISDLFKDKRFRYCLVFKNYGSLAGGKGIEHLHSQIIALPATPHLVKTELSGARAYYNYKERCIFCDILANELAAKERILYESEHFVYFAPYASRFPFEITGLPRRHLFAYELASEEELFDFGKSLILILGAIFNALSDPPYNYILHTAPNLLRHPPGSGYWTTIKDDYHWHLDIIPRVKRTDGFEWGSGFFYNPVAPEKAVEILKNHLR